ncbi:antitoxin Xre/MbcA/ParS toxin-binding domain-containing protein [Mycolicibacter sp. MYC123]|uniref:Antitoxin Xre/MbcA/ParS toxin-binding domain-containing protein n=1 Tax=[Mycobacterium] zoologicum TaxID=2872311 RepID=A0ABU5YPU8_9MYCO|nr:antitoxin Xre/MbcA/ParS toxin-binding domain-containing protein [Mycolicibacter sp. MYC123]MEB3052101.1 antitoxin Xre/MbcA/ParS toxin-binding domain-containing protein [Mycolicibacter sp. MYC123]
MGANALASTVSSAIEHLGLTYEEVGDIVDASARSVARWTSGQVVPQRLNKQRLIELAYVADALTEVLPRDQANVWMFSPNRLLTHSKPADLVRDGEYQRVLALIDAMAEGTFA